ncbi:MAG: hypothetical protein KDB23_28740 [Planctomycetales bacterium]|nr:hypothetical protein [Planctomycetales bacterium]
MTNGIYWGDISLQKRVIRHATQRPGEKGMLATSAVAAQKPRGGRVGMAALREFESLNVHGI